MIRRSIYTFGAAVILLWTLNEFAYDAENRQVAVENGSSQLIGQYYFDSDGKRVKKVVPNGETTIFVYDASGRLIGEYSTEVQPAQDAKTQYLTADHLGTPRINTNGIGAVVSRSDYMPYGEEITSGRSSGQGYVVDDVRQAFTGYENDDETGLDYAQATKETGVNPANLRFSARISGRMARKLRIEVEGGLYHVITRGNDRRDVFHSARDHLKFLDLLGKEKVRSAFYLYAFCLMTNHIHLLIERRAETVGIRRTGVNPANLQYSGDS